ncbi:MAG: hypothetical protein ACO31I_05260 [Prochlorotrichaceae cyanobacterium]|jgi:hypothetical protein
MSKATLSRIYACLRNDHLCCLIGEPAEGHTYEIDGIHREFYNTGFVVIRLDIDRDVNPTTSRAASTQGWYETFFNLILGQLQRSSFSVTTQQRREIRSQSQLIINNLNSFEEFYRILEDIASTQQRSFLLHFTEIHCLEDPESNLSERDILFFLEAIDSYCSNFTNALASNSTADFSQPGLYFLLQGKRFPRSDGLKNSQIIDKSIIYISPQTPQSSPPLTSTQNSTNESDQISDIPTELIPEIYQHPSTPSTLETIESFDTGRVAHEITTLVDKETVNNYASIDLSIDPKTSDISNVNSEWISQLRFVALGFIGATFLIPLVLSQVRSPESVVITTSPEPKLSPPISPPEPIPEPISQTPTSVFTPTKSPKSFDKDLILKTIRQRTVYFYGSTGKNYSGQVFFSELRDHSNRPDESGVAARIEWNDGVISAILFRDNFRVRVWEAEKEYSGRWYWNSDQSKLIVEMDNGAKYEF